ncbi:histidine phosphatase family protein [Demequina activiva]|uniref:Fructose 1,6-bisphosphatase n=1 Tax=Demequina activiva TaxID=1582364 RepID=A0A919UKA4_9MICO|nr:histidine phosphatase family protein [Demequina activiva]GIG55091.1 fructose 1,6-bisphosphatase [Demequina activiva]
MRVFVVRHGQTAWNVQGLLQGAADVPLTDEGRAQAEASALVLRRIVGRGATVVASPLSRAHDTARVIARELDVDAHPDDRLRERAYGVWEGITAQEREKGWPEEVAMWRAHGNPEIEGFEHHDSVRARMVEAIEEWAGRASGPLVIVTHGSSGRVGMQGLLGLSLAHRTLGNLGNAAWSRLTRRSEGDWTLERHNIRPQSSEADA